MTVAKVLIAALLANGAAQAATLENVQGDVRVGRDKGFSAVHGPVEWFPGDKVKIGSKGHARIVYPDGCKINLGANALAMFAEHSPCSFTAQADGSDAQNYSCQGLECLGPPALVAGNLSAGVGAALASAGGSGAPPPALLPLIQKPASP